jgi:hypothetical protein
VSRYGGSVNRHAAADRACRHRTECYGRAIMAIDRMTTAFARIEAATARIEAATARAATLRDEALRPAPEPIAAAMTAPDTGFPDTGLSGNDLLPIGAGANEATAATPAPGTAADDTRHADMAARVAEAEAAHAALAERHAALRERAGAALAELDALIARVEPN